jgi:hypothetical protein
MVRVRPRRRHMLLIRDYVGVKAWGEETQQSMESASQDAARTLEDLADIINVALEQFVRHRFELLPFSVLHRAAQHARAVVNREYHSLVCDRLDAAARQRLDLMLTRNPVLQAVLFPGASPKGRPEPK